MKIAQITHHYLPHIGGVEFYVKRLADSLHARGIEVDVLTTDLGTSEHGRKPEATYFKTSFSYLRNPFSIAYIKHLRKADYDILHLHSVWFLHGLMAVVFRKKARIISTIHGVYPDHSSAKLNLFLGLYKYFVAYILRKSEKVLVYSEIERNKVQKIFKVPSEKIVVIPMAINLEPYEDRVKDKIILFTGRIIPDKNPDLLIKATALLDHRFHHYTLVFVGPIEEKYKQQLLELAKELSVSNEIIFAGQLDPSVDNEKEQLINHYKSASVFTSLGSWEGQPTRLMEAMQHKTPVIAYAAGGTADFVTDNKNGFVIDKLDEVLLADRLKRILLDERLAKKLGAEARQTIEQDYSWDKIFDRIFLLYQGDQKYPPDAN